MGQVSHECVRIVYETVKGNLNVKKHAVAMLQLFDPFF